MSVKTVKIPIIFRIFVKFIKVACERLGNMK